MRWERASGNFYPLLLSLTVTKQEGIAPRGLRSPLGRDAEPLSYAQGKLRDASQPLLRTKNLARISDLSLSY
jgi:hypothetical protein